MSEPDFTDLAWELIIQQEASLRRLCWRACRGRRDMLDELWCDVVVLRMPEVLRTFKPELGGSLMGHVTKNLRWYMFKYMNRRARDHGRFKQTADFTPLERPVKLDADAKLEVQLLLERLRPYDRSLLQLYFFCNYTITELAGVLGISYAMARKHFHAALEDAKAKMRQ